jgi:hypothetical protein
VKKVAKEVREEAKETAKEEAQGQACQVNSFVPGTRVLMADGSTKPIEKVRPGDKVVATDARTGRTSVQTAAATIVGKGSKDLVRITLTVHDGSSAKTVTVTATAGHPFWVPSLREWVDAGELKPGQWLQTSSGTWIQIGAVEAWTAKKVTVHNLTVTDVHTYYVLAGRVPLLAHNCKTDAELQADADAIHETWRARYGERAYNGTTVTTAVLDGELVYAVNQGKTNEDARALAESLGYRRVFGARLKGPKQTDAEQILLNAVDRGEVGSSGRMATSRIPCGTRRQNCGGRIGSGKYPNIRVVGRWGAGTG